MRIKTHWPKHFRSENPRITDFNPLAQTFMVAENLHAGLGVWIISWLETEFLHTQLLEKAIQHTNQVTQSEIIVSNKAFNLMKFSQVRCIHRLISKDTIDRKVLG